MRDRVWLVTAAAVGAVAASATIVVTGDLAIAVAVAVGFIVLVALRPAIGACAYLAVTPLVAGLGRDLFVPALRIHELMLGLIVIGLLMRGLARMFVGHRYTWNPSRLDTSVAALAVTGSMVTLLWRFSQGGEILVDDILHAAVFPKYLALYVVFRVAIRAADEARAALWVALGTTAVVGVIGILQALGLFGVPEFLFRFYPPFLGDTIDIGRGASTLALTFAVADVSLICLGAAAVLAREARGRRRTLLVGLMVLYFLSAIAAGQFSGFIGIAVAVIALGYALGEMRQVLRLALPAALIGAVALSPIIATRLSGFGNRGGMPQSWTVRMDNLSRFILPEFGNGWNILLGVRPAARVPAPEVWRDFVYIESGYVWLLWSGGIPLLIAFCYFAFVAMRMLRGVIAFHTVEVRAIATGAFVGIWVIVVLNIFDPHLTMRGVADLIFPLLAMSQIPRVADSLKTRTRSKELISA